MGYIRVSTEVKALVPDEQLRQLHREPFALYTCCITAVMTAVAGWSYGSRARSSDQTAAPVNPPRHAACVLA
jgi:hypothetical protein